MFYTEVDWHCTDVQAQFLTRKEKREEEEMVISHSDFPYIMSTCLHALKVKKKEIKTSIDGGGWGGGWGHHSKAHILL